jgi:hypothetical protein
MKFEKNSHCKCSNFFIIAKLNVKKKISFIKTGKFLWGLNNNNYFCSLASPIQIGGQNRK